MLKKLYAMIMNLLVMWGFIKPKKTYLDETIEDAAETLLAPPFLTAEMANKKSIEAITKTIENDAKTFIERRIPEIEIDILNTSKDGGFICGFRPLHGYKGTYSSTVHSIIVNEITNHFVKRGFQVEMECIQWGRKDDTSRASEIIR